jgi:hypothetical protein
MPAPKRTILAPAALPPAAAGTSLSLPSLDPLARGR